MIDIQNLSVTFAGASRAAVSDLSLQIKKGSVTALVGESGSGKSMTALAIGGLLPSGANVSGAIQKGGARLGYVFQDPGSSLNPLMRVGQQILEACAVTHPRLSTKQMRERVVESIRAVDMQDVERVYRAYPHELSGGMRQRAMIAMALIREPDFLIADEPTTALDKVVERQVVRLISRLQKERGFGVLFITHDLVLADKIADALSVMRAGRLVEAVKKIDGRFIYQEKYTRALFDAESIKECGEK